MTLVTLLPVIDVTRARERGKPSNLSQASRHLTMPPRVARGSLSGRWPPRGDGHPNLTGAITIEQALPAGTKLWLSGWTRSAASSDEFVSLVATVAIGGSRRARRRREAAAEPEGKFRDVDHVASD